MKKRYLGERNDTTIRRKYIDTICGIVNENWKNVYSGYVNPLLLNSDGCAARTRRLKTDGGRTKI